MRRVRKLRIYCKFASLFSETHILTPEQKSSEDSLASVATAILQSSQEEIMIDQGLKSIVSEPAYGIFKCQGLSFNGLFKCLEQQCYNTSKNLSKIAKKNWKDVQKLL